MLAPDHFDSCSLNIDCLGFNTLGNIYEVLGGCSVLWRMFGTMGVSSVLWRDTISTVGDTISTLKVVLYLGGYHQYYEGNI